MVLSDVDIRRYIAQGKIRISPELPPEQFGSCSVDFKLGNEFNVFEHSRNAYIDLRENKGIDGLMKSVIVPTGEPFILQPREFVLAITEETLELDADVLGVSVNGRGGASATTEDRMMGFGPLALYAGGSGEVRYKEVSYKNLNPKFEPKETVSPNFQMQRISDFYYGWCAAAADINRALSHN